MKFVHHKGVFRVWVARKIGREQKGETSGVGEGKEGNAHCFSRLSSFFD